MDENVERLVRELRSETCPQRVLDQVARRIPRNAAPWRLFEIAVVVVATFVVLALWRWPTGSDSHGKPESGFPAAANSAQAAQQAKVALGCVGAALRDAGTRSEAILLKEAVPSLRNSLETAKNKIWNTYNQL